MLKHAKESGVCLVFSFILAQVADQMSAILDRYSRS